MKYSWDKIILTNALDVAEAPIITFGNLVPEGVVSALPGSMYLCTIGGAGTTLYVKESGTGNTGWVGK